MTATVVVTSPGTDAVGAEVASEIFDLLTPVRTGGHDVRRFEQ